MKKAALFLTILSLAATHAFASEKPAIAKAQSLAAGEAFVLVDMGSKGPLKSYVSSLTFAHNKAGIKLSVPKENGMQLVKVKAGVYQPEEFGISKTSDRTKPLSIPANKKGIFVEPGTVTYIGNWDIYYGQQTMMNGSRIISEKQGYRVSYNVDNLFEFANQNRWIKKYPLRVSHMNGKRIANNWLKADNS